MVDIGCLMSKDFDKIAAIEKAIAKKYGEETIQNPRANWTEEKEQEYLEQMKEFYSSRRNIKQSQEKVDVNGIKISKKLLNRESLNNCPVCGSFPKKSMDDVCLVKFDCCNQCYVQYVEGREERWLQGWRPNK
jgi:formate dehydrogenase maturation protein FdhE